MNKKARLEALDNVRNFALLNASVNSTVEACRAQLILDPAAREYFVEHFTLIVGGRIFSRTGEGGEQLANLMDKLETGSYALKLPPAARRAIGGALGVAASIGSMGEVVKPEFWKGLNTLLQSDDPVGLLSMAIAQTVVERQGDYAMFARLNDEIGKGMVVGRSAADIVMMVDAIASLPMLAAKVGQLGAVVVINGIRYANIGGKIVRQAFADIKQAIQAPSETIVGSLEPGNPLSTSLPRNGDRLVIDQGNVKTCGPNSCGMVLDTMGKPVDIAKLVSDAKITKDGTTMPELIRVLRQNGLPEATLYKGVTIEFLAQATSNGEPAIVAMGLD